MRIHHLNCGSMCPLATLELVCHCLLIECGERLVLVESGFGMLDIEQPRMRLGRILPLLFRAALKPEQTAIAQVRALGFDPRDVRDIILTHLDVDHIGGISDFPWATVHVTKREYEGAFASPTAKERARYGLVRWARDARFEPYKTVGDRWFEFECVRDLKGLPPEILLVPLSGHTPGHSGVAVQGPEGWILHCGDAYFYHGEMAARYHCPWTLKLFQIGAIENRMRRENQQRLRELVAQHGAEVKVLCAHDAHELHHFRAATVSGSSARG